MQYIQLIPDAIDADPIRDFYVGDRTTSHLSRPTGRGWVQAPQMRRELTDRWDL